MAQRSVLGFWPDRQGFTSWLSAVRLGRSLGLCSEPQFPHLSDGLIMGSFSMGLFLFIVKYTYHKMYHFNCFQMNNSVSLVRLQCGAAITSSSSGTFSLPKRKLYPLGSHSPLGHLVPHRQSLSNSPSCWPLEITDLLSVSMDLLFLNISYTWNH